MSKFLRLLKKEFAGAVTVCMLLCPHSSKSQKAYFIDGFHGGVWGHYPVGQTSYMVDMLNKYPEWKINIEIEPETWDNVRRTDSAGYFGFKKYLSDQSYKGRIEIINPSYAQSYLYNISGESIIRQFHYGIKKTKEHFPEAVFTTYSSEEPCFTSALPQILKSYGYKYASLKNPNTCWGGYTRAYGGELVNWIGPDGSSLLTVPRYAIEDLQSNTTWRTMSSDNPKNYIEAALKYGIKNPVGMTLQDAMWNAKPWNEGPWLEGKLNATDNFPKAPYQPTEYKTWRDYFANASVKTTKDNWRFSQEDVLVSLVWGSQILQKIAQQVRIAENKIVNTERLAAIQYLQNKKNWPAIAIDSAWKTLLLSQHHDCWIVPYNGRGGNTWADKVRNWTANTVRISDSITRSFAIATSKTEYIKLTNTTGQDRTEWVQVPIPENSNSKEIQLTDKTGKPVPVQIINNSESWLIKASIPSMGSSVYQLMKIVSEKKGTDIATKLSNDNLKIETDLYTIILDQQNGGRIKSLKAKKLDNKEFIDQASANAFNGLKGNFFRDTGMKSSKENPAVLTILENGAASASVSIRGSVAGYSFTQILTVNQGQERIDCSLKIDWTGNPGIGNAYRQKERWQAQERQKAFYDDRDKLLLLFPLNLKSPKIYKDAPFDVTASRLQDTYFDRWDSIKNNILLNWVDLTAGDNSYGMTIFSDHTTSYVFGKDHPLSLTVQYSGMGLWGRNYTITGPTEIRYALFPHKGKWDKAGVMQQLEKWSSPVLAGFTDKPSSNDWNTQMVAFDKKGWQLSAATIENNQLLLRIFNASGDALPANLFVNSAAEKVELIDLNGNKVQDLLLKRKDSGVVVSIGMPQFGFRTLRFTLKDD